MNKKLLYVSIAVIGLFMISSIAPTQSLQIRDKNFKSNAASTRPDTWIVDMQNNFDNPTWFYDNLNAADRQKIRQALDFGIPRQEIIDSILDGHGLLLATTMYPQQGVYYDASVVPRTFNQTKAAELLTEVFGYEFADADDNPNTTYDESLTYFRLTMTVPSTNPLRSQWAARISYSYLALGIDIVYKQWSWNTIIDRIFDNKGYENSYENGGFDAQFIGWGGGGSLPGDRYFFHSGSVAPVGGNYQGIISADIDAMVEEQETTKNVTRRIELYHQQQQMFVDDVWRSILFQSTEVWAYDSNMLGFNPYFGASIPYQNITFTTGNEQSTLVASRPGEFTHFNPFISNSWYDNYVLGQLQFGLRTTSTPSGDMTFAAWQMYEMFADWWNKSADELDFFFNMKSGLVWEDGTELNTSDVAFSYDAMLNGAFPSTATYGSQLTNSSSGGIIVHNATLIEFKMSRWDPFTEITKFGLPILPKSQLGNVSLDQWSTHATDSDASLMSNGPYTFVSVNNQVAYLKNSTTWTPSYYNKFSSVPYMNYPVISNVTIVLNNQADVALTALKNGEIDIIDSQSGLASIFNQIEVGGQAKSQEYVGGSWQEFGVNQGSPVWGMNPVKPTPPTPTGTSTTAAATTTSAAGGTTTAAATTTSAAGGTTPFGDIVTIAAAFVTVAAISFTLRRRRN